ncbi:MAG: MATE family efflux transporter [Gammaproteobacteria bacterium]|nr:MATE family efflux transporter [Gammaproteobacteria bacterium]
MPDPRPVPTPPASHSVWRLAWPTIISNLLFNTVGFLHIKIVAGLGTSGVAAVATGHRVFFLIQAILMGVSVASTALIARNWGAGRVAEAALVNWTAMLLSLCLAGLLSLPILFAPEAIAGLFGLDRETTVSAAGFIFWLGVFSLAPAANLVLSSGLRATGDVITPLLFLFFSSLLNVSFAYVLAFGLGPFPKLAVSGIALGGSFAGMLVTACFVAFWWRGRFNLKATKRARVDWDIARQLVKIGTPAMLEQGLVQGGFLVFFGIVARYGTNAFAAYGIGISLVAFAIVVGFGFGIAAATMVGQQLGAGRPDLALAAGWRALRLALLTMGAIALVQVWYARELASFMIADPEVIDLTVVFIYMLAACLPMMACDLTLAGALRGAGETRFPLKSTFCGMVFGRLIPAGIFLSLELSVYWIYAVMLFDYSIKAAMLVRRYHSRKWLGLGNPTADPTKSLQL